MTRTLLVSSIHALQGQCSLLPHRLRIETEVGKCEVWVPLHAKKAIFRLD